jgi:hypothetical protein
MEKPTALLNHRFQANCILKADIPSLSVKNMQIKIMADYECPPLWWDNMPQQVGPILPETLGLSDQLCADLWLWAAAFDATLVRDDPRLSGFATEAAEREFNERGKALVARVAGELGPAYSVKYWRE